VQRYGERYGGYVPREPHADIIAVGFDDSHLKLGSAAIPNLRFPKPE
jgi:hypothetical protein